MALEGLLAPEMITAISVSTGALMGGGVAILSEFRRRRADAPTVDGQRAGLDLEEEFEHLNRSLWIVEKRLSDRLVSIEGQMTALSRVAALSARGAAASGSGGPAGGSGR